MASYESRQVLSQVGSQAGPIRRVVITAIVAFALLWLGGLLAFVHKVGSLGAQATPNADGIVVLTGGGERLDAALKLLQQGKAQRLLITGVHENISAADLSDVTIGSQQIFECCVDLGKSALNTRGNAIEAAKWAGDHNYKRLIIVTANYHMPRSLAEFRTAIPNVELIPYPVAPRDLKLGDWWQHAGTTSLLAGEYTKYLLSLTRVGMAPVRTAGQ